MHGMAKDIIKDLGGNATVAKALSVRPNVVANWKLRGSIPLAERFRIAELARVKKVSLPDGFLPTVGM
jgi:hypothetical protein